VRILKILLISTLFPFGAVNAATTSQTLCFVNQKNSRVELVLRKYLDEDLQQEIGAFAKYSSSKSIIPLVFISDSTTDPSVDYELNWLEIYNEKITGQYRLLKPKKATIQGAYVKYKNLKTGKEMVFSPTAKSEDECAAMLK
jgi:hypothetical protein